LITKQIAALKNSASPIDVVGAALKANGEICSRTPRACPTTPSGLDARRGPAGTRVDQAGRRWRCDGRRTGPSSIGEPAAKLTAETGVAVSRSPSDRGSTATKDTDLARVVGESLDEFESLTATT